MKIEVPDRNDPTKNVTIQRYVIDSKEEPTAIIYGKFSPWTGPNGHGVLVDYAKSAGFKNIVVASPQRKGTDKSVDMFTQEQKTAIIEKATGLKFISLKSGSPAVANSELIKEHGIERPVFIIGTDRIAEFSKYFIPYKKSNTGATDTKDSNFGKGEFDPFDDREGKEVSGTTVRKALMDNDKDRFIELSHYDSDMWNFMRSMLKKNGVIKEFMSFRDFYLTEGGHIVINGESAEKIPMEELGPDKFGDFKKEFHDALYALNVAYKKKSGHLIWDKFDEVFKSGRMFSGSTRSFFTKDYEYFTNVKKKVGDMDVQFPAEYEKELDEFLTNNAGKKFGNMTLVGNAGTLYPVTIFKTSDKFDGIIKNIQVDFEPTFWEEGAPTDFSVFSHYSSFTDMKSNIKGFASKYLMRALVGRESLGDISVLTKTGKVSKAVGTEQPGKYSFSVDKGVRQRYEPVLGDDGKPKIVDGKPAYKEKDTKDSTYERNLDTILTDIFGQKLTDEEKKKVHSYIGALDVMKKYLTKDDIQGVFTRLISMLWGKQGQEIEKDSKNPEGDLNNEDYKIKKSIYDAYIKVFPFVAIDNVEDIASNFYKGTPTV